MSAIDPEGHVWHVWGLWNISQALTYTTEPIIAAKGQTIQSISKVSWVNRNGRPMAECKLQIPEMLRVSGAV